MTTDWIDPDEDHERAVRRFIARLYRSEAFLADLEAFVAEVAPRGEEAALGQTLLKLTAPGVPDLYQGDELWCLSLVDPDNRRPVDWDRRRRLLDGLLAGEPPRRETAKLFLIHRALALRARRPEAFAGSYRPLDAGAGAFAYARGDAVIAAMPIRAGGEGERDRCPGGPARALARRPRRPRPRARCRGGARRPLRGAPGGTAGARGGLAQVGRRQGGRAQVGARQAGLQAPDEGVGVAHAGLGDALVDPQLGGGEGDAARVGRVLRGAGSWSCWRAARRRGPWRGSGGGRRACPGSTWPALTSPPVRPASRRLVMPVARRMAAWSMRWLISSWRGAERQRVARAACGPGRRSRPGRPGRPGPARRPPGRW